ncbi:MAG: hydroxymethylglutaryl-CoA lyase [Moraxellaceae bacterium]|nr:hydroxymethylglutaryl-CoA lyase [Moraxellaceae bacterium]
MTEHIRITEVGLRDGLQNQPHPVSTDGKLELARALILAGVRQLETASFVHPKAVPQMADAAEITAGLPVDARMDYMALVPNLKGYERARAAGYRRVAVVLASTDTFNLRNIKMTRDEAEAACRDVLAAAKNDGVAVRAYVSGALACPYDGPTPVAVVQQLCERMIAAGAVDIAISDTIGAGNPRQIQQILTPLLREHDPALFSLHLHDTRGTALAMAWAGLECGVRHFDASVGGLGGCPFAPGATGNVATEDLVHLFHGAGFDTGIDLDRLYDAVAIAERITAQPLGGRYTQWRRSQERRAQATACAPQDNRA